MATSRFPTVLFYLCMFLLCHRSMAQLFGQSSTPWQSPRQGGLIECRFNKLQAFEPVRQVRSQAGFTEYFDEQNELFRCTGVSVIRRVVQPQGLIVPQYHNAHGLVYILQGTGFTGLTFPGCPATFQQPFQPFDQAQFVHGQSQTLKFQDEHQKVHRFKQGDVVALPAGIVHWCYNDGDVPVVAVYVFDVNNNANQLEPRQKDFLLAGNNKRDQQFGKNIFSGFSVQLLSEAFGISQQTTQRIQSQNDQRGDIIRVNQGLQFLRPIVSEQGPLEQQTYQPIQGQTEQSAQYHEGQTTQYQQGKFPQYQQGQSTQFPQYQQGQSTQYQQGQFPQYQGGQSTQYQQGKFPQYQKGQSSTQYQQGPQHQEGQSTQHQQGVFPQFQKGQPSTQYQQGQLPQHHEGQSIQYQQGQLPQHQEGQSTQYQQGRPWWERQSTQYQPGQFPWYQEGQSSQHQQGRFPQYQEGQSTQCQQGRSPQNQEVQSRSGSFNGLEENFCSLEARLNIENPKRADTYNPRAGRITSLNGNNFPILSLVQLSARRVNLYQNAVLSPFWSINAHSVLYAIQGQARIQVVNNHGQTVFNDRLRKGQLLIIPQHYVVLKKAEREGFQYISFKTNANPLVSQIAGKNSILQGLPVDIIANAYRISRQEARNLKNNRGQEFSVFTPRVTQTGFESYQGTNEESSSTDKASE